MMTKRVRKREPKTATSNMTALRENESERKRVKKRAGSGRDGPRGDQAAPPVPGTGNAPVARRVISPYTSGSVENSPRTQVFRLPW